MPSPFPAECVYLTGPTASGKSAVGVELAKRLDAEIIALDSMTVYRGLDIGTAKPTPAERGGIAHHLLDVVDPGEEFSQAQYAESARVAVDDILARGKTPLFVGGTPLYLKTLLRGMFEGPPPDWEFRHRLEQETNRRGQEWLRSQLAVVDPAAAAKLHVNDSRRMIRALEVYEKTGTPLSTLQQEFETPRDEARGRAFVLHWPRTELGRRIDLRVDAMIAAGLIDEVRRAAEAPGGLSRTARQGLGYREVLAYFAGECDLPTTIDLIKTHTRQFAKRQGTWFRSLEEVTPIEMSEPADVAATATKIHRLLATSDARP